MKIFFALIIGCWISSLVVGGRTFQVAVIQSLSQGGRIFPSEHIFASFMMIPYAVRHFNERNTSILPILGELKGCSAKLKLIDDAIFDDQGSSGLAIYKLMRTLGSKRVDFLHGPTLSEVGMTLGLSAGAVSLPIVSHCSSSDRLNDKLAYPTMVRTIPSDRQVAEAVADLFVYFKFRTVGLVHSTDAYGSSFRDMLSAACANRSITLYIGGYDYTASGQALMTDMAKALKTVIGGKANVIFRVVLTIEAELTYSRLATRMNWVANKLHIGRSSVGIDDVLAYANGRFERVYSEFIKGSLLVLVSFDLKNELATKMINVSKTFDIGFINSFLPNETTSVTNQTKKIPPDYFTKDPPNDLRVTYSASAYDSVIALGLAACQTNLSNLTRNLEQVEFWGTSGYVKFSRRTLARVLDARGFSLYLLNVVTDNDMGTLEERHVGIFDRDSKWIVDRQIIFQNGSLVPPKDADYQDPVLDNITFGAKVFASIETAIGLSLSLFSVVKPYASGRSKASFEESMCDISLAIGTLILVLAIVPLVVDVSLGCSLFMWFFGIGMCVCLCTLYTVAWISLTRWHSWRTFERANRKAAFTFGDDPIPQSFTTLDHQESFRFLTCRRATLIAMPFFVVISLLVAMQSSGSMVMLDKVIQTDGEDRPLLIVRTCEATSAVSTGLIAGLVSFIGLLAFAAFGNSLYVLAKVPKDRFPHMSASTVASAWLLQIYLLAVPAALAVWNTGLASFLILTSACFLMCMVTLIAVILPKVLNWRSNPRAPTSKSASAIDHSDSKTPIGSDHQSHHLTGVSSTTTRKLPAFIDLDELHQGLSDGGGAPLNTGRIGRTLSRPFSSSMEPTIMHFPPQLTNQSGSPSPNSPVPSQEPVSSTPPLNPPRKIPGFVDLHQLRSSEFQVPRRTTTTSVDEYPLLRPLGTPPPIRARVTNSQSGSGETCHDLITT